jgi:hypothetical protein
MITVSLRDWAVTGAFGPVALGCTRAALQAAFGAPEDVGGTSREYRRPTIWKYGDVEFHFPAPGDELALIHIDYFNGPGETPHGWGGLELDPWVIRVELAREALVRAVEEVGRPWSLRDDPLFNQSVVVLPSGVEVGFVHGGLAWLSQHAGADE